MCNPRYIIYVDTETSNKHLETKVRDLVQFLVQIKTGSEKKNNSACKVFFTIHIFSKHHVFN